MPPQVILVRTTAASLKSPRTEISEISRTVNRAQSRIVPPAMWNCRERQKLPNVSMWNQDLP